jgi:hypothetical protein
MNRKSEKKLPEGASFLSVHAINKGILIAPRIL